jgi:hypothetical protein
LHIFLHCVSLSATAVSYSSKLASGANVISHFSLSLTTRPNKLELPGKPFQSGLIFAGKKRARERCSTRIGSGLTHKYYTRLERFNRDKHFILFGLFVSFISEAPRAVLTTLQFFHNVQVSPKS